MIMLNSKDSKAALERTPAADGPTRPPKPDRSDSPPRAMTPADIRHNMILLVLIDMVWLFGWTEMQLASSPLYVYLKASNTLIGLISATFILGLFGVFLSPFITIHFPLKKVYLLVVHIPYLLPWGLIGLGLIFSRQLGLSNHGLLVFILLMSVINGLAAGFVTLPHQEYIAACIPMSHRGRLSGYGNSLGSGLAVISNALAGWVLLVVAKPEAYGYLYVMTWFICQVGFIFALFARERPTPVEKSPKPWSKSMIKAAWSDKPYIRVVLMQSIYYLLIMPLFYQFVAVYGFRELKMPPASAAVIGVIQRLFSLCICVYIGHLIDRFSPKRFLQYLPLAIVVTILPLLLWHHPFAVYLSLALSQIVHVGQYGSFNALIYGLPSPENRAGHFTFQILASYISMALGPVLIGGMCDLFSYRSTFLIILALGFVLLPLTRSILAPLSTHSEDYS